MHPSTIELQSETETRKSKNSVAAEYIPEKIPEVPSFARGLNFYKLFWVFVVCCIIGVIVETVYHYIKFGVIHSTKGLIYGPFNQVYGFGGVLITLCCSRLAEKRIAVIFTAGALVGASFEYLCSFLQEKAFGTLSWEYSGSFLSIGGRTNMKYAVFWGLLAVTYTKFLYPHLSRLIERIPNRQGILLTWILCVMLILDMGISAAALYRQSQRLEGEPADSVVDVFLDYHYSDSRLQQVYPNMKTASEARMQNTSTP